MCAARMQRLLTSMMLGLTLYFFLAAAADFQAGLAASTNFIVALSLQGFVIFMMTVWAVTNFCPSSWMMGKLLPPCSWERSA